MAKLFAVILIAFSTMLMSGCATRAALGYGDGYHRSEGPPPHAPAHGYRHKYHDHQLSYDSKLGAYVVIGYDDYFFLDDLYFRYRDGDWQYSVSMNDRDWHHADYRQVPYKLRNSKSSKYGKQKGNGKHKHKDKKWDD